MPVTSVCMWCCCCFFFFHFSPAGCDVNTDFRMLSTRWMRYADRNVSGGSRHSRRKVSGQKPSFSDRFERGFGFGRVLGFRVSRPVERPWRDKGASQTFPRFHCCAKLILWINIGINVMCLKGMLYIFLRCELRSGFFFYLFIFALCIATINVKIYLAIVDWFVFR